MKKNNKEVFKQNLHLIEIETFSYCNRKCWFCPNSFIDRLSHNEVMPEEVYLDLLDQLKEIDFSGEFSFNRFNEPLSHRELFILRIKQARQALPNATLRTNTNGDYVTREYIEELCDVGFNELWIQQYLANEDRYDHEEMRQRAEGKLSVLGLPYEVITDIAGCKLEYDISHRGMTIHIRARNFELDGNSQGNSVDIAGDYTRTQRCTLPSERMYIDYNGSIMVCCALRSDVPGHESGIMGHVGDGKLWDIYASDRYKPWRDHHKEDGPKEGLCKSCRENITPPYEEIKLDG
jgi:MoaA/NifB/PqqE/SkfB family radical SAM enzyme